MSRYRIESDTLGKVRVPRGALWGAQTARAVENFPVSGLRADPVLTRAYVLIKKAAALSNFVNGALDERLARAIASSCDEVLGGRAGEFDELARVARGRGRVRVVDPVGLAVRKGEADPASIDLSEKLSAQFVVDIFQAGAGTSFNMNCNEVLANLANRALGGRIGAWSPVHPNDHVNMSQSTNDTFPTATRLSILLLAPRLIAALRALVTELDRKARLFDRVIKSGRTHLQDAVPVTLGQELRAWARTVEKSARLLVTSLDEIRELGIGGTATGTGVNTPKGYRSAVVRLLTKMTGLELRASEDLREAMQSQLPATAVSAALRNVAIELGRIANDLRLMSSGPTAGLGEIELPPVQPGSSIMPGKVNPSIPECLNQVCLRVIGADATVAAAAGAGQLELNVMMPLIASETLFSLRILGNFLPIFSERCIAGIVANRDRNKATVERSSALATLLNPIIGYERAAEIAKESTRTGRSIPELIRERGILSEKELKEIFSRENLVGRE